MLAALPLGLIMFYGCHDLVPHDTRSLLLPEFQLSEIFGFVAGFGTTFAAVPDLVAINEATIVCTLTQPDKFIGFEEVVACRGGS
jgi:hypothetical protein